VNDPDAFLARETLADNLTDMREKLLARGWSDQGAESATLIIYQLGAATDGLGA
jgi:hypothetical protein